MLRPATPLTVLLLLAFVLLLLSVISTPIVKTIPLGSFEGADFGVFGFCRNSRCSGIKVGYSAGKFGPSSNASPRIGIFGDYVIVLRMQYLDSTSLVY